MFRLLRSGQKSVLNLFFLLSALFAPTMAYAQSIGVTNPASSTSYCAGTNVNVTFTISGVFSNVPSPNVFSAQISDAVGSFSGSPVTIGTRTNTTAGTIACTLPSTLLTSNLYRIRVISSNPAVNGSDNGADLSVFAIVLNAPTLNQSSFCLGESFALNFTQGSCNFVNTPAPNVYSVELSNASGSFTNPVVIGTYTGVTSNTIACQIPPSTTAGSGYRMRVVASSPSVTGPDNGSNLTILSAPGTPSVFGNGRWNVYCYTARNSYTANYMGFYTETSLSFNTTTRWATNSSPSSANATGGNAYTGCVILPASFSYAYKRTNIPCGYYQVDVPSHRHEVYIIINGTTVFSHTAASGDAHTNAFRGVIEPADEVEIRCSNLSSSGNLQVTFTKLNQLTMSAPVTVCANTTATLVANNTGTLPVNFSWTPTISISPTTGSTVIGTPAVTTTYVATGSDPVTGCDVFSNSVIVTVSPLPATSSTITTSGILCNGYSNVTISASGANTYSWSPAAGLNTTTGTVVVASPTVTTVYTVTGSNNCATSTSIRTVTVKNPPASPQPTAFGNGTWNVYCYNGTALTDYYGYYTENNLSFDSRNRWAANSTPSIVTSSTAGIAYSGCNLFTSAYGTISKRTNFTCGYYRISLTHDDNVTLLINGTQVFQHNATGDTDPNAWTGFLGAASTVEIRQINTSAGSGYIAASFIIVPVPALSPPVTICFGSSTTLTAAVVSGVSYAWTPASGLSTTSGTITTATPAASTNYTCTITDALTGCQSATSVSVTINPLPTTSVTPLASTINCQAETYVLTATGANTYSWNPSTGLSASTGNSVQASPAVTTVYTVTGNNNCSSVDATATVVVVPLVNPTVFPSGTWNAYCYNSATLTNYYGFYTEDGSGTSGYDFNTTTRWASGASPSTTSSINGQAYKGCTMPATNWTMSFKRTGFACNTYTLNVLSNLDNITIFINGNQVATRAGNTASASLWSGVLSPATTVEMRLQQTTGTSGLSVAFVPATSGSSTCVWSGATSTDWFNTANWCGSKLPALGDDVIIYNTGTVFQPLIGAAGAECHDLTTWQAAASTSTSSAIPAASLIVSGAFGLDVYGDWYNNGFFNPGTGTVNILGSGAKTVSCTSTQTLNRLVINNSGNVTFSSGTHRISGSMDFISGIIKLNGTLVFLNTATATNASDACYVEGPVVKFGNQPFTFPVGLNGSYRPISISAPVSTTDNFTAQYFYANASPPYTSSSKDASVDHISSCEYWILNRTGGSSIVNVTLSWNQTSCGITDINDLLVTRWDAGQVKWKDHGGSNITGNAMSGTLRSTSPITAFSPFTLGSKSALNPLPVELLDFSAACVNDGVELKWQTASEQNTSSFAVESSEDGHVWRELGRKQAAGNSSVKKQYQFRDQRALQEIRYFRLVQIDRDEQKELSKIISVNCPSLRQDFKVFPNPATNEINVVIQSSGSDGSGALRIVDHLGQVCYSRPLDLKKGANMFMIPLTLSPGVYFISYTANQVQAQVKKLVVE